MLYPKSLEKGYRIGVTATSAGFDNEVDLIRLDSGIKHFEELGYPVIVTDNVRRCSKGRSSDGPTRAKELTQLFCDPEVSVIIAASGGDYLIEMLPFLDLEVIRDNPKWMQGYSDTTGILFTITTNLELATIYGTNFSSFGMANWHSSLMDNLRILQGQEVLQQSFTKYQDGFQPRITGLEEYVLEKEVSWVNLFPSSGCSMRSDYAEIDGNARETGETCGALTIKGRALGGCLDVLLDLVGTRFDKTRQFIEKYKQDKILWFFESFDLSGEALARGLWQLKEAGWFEHASGFVFGRPAMYRSDYEITYEEAVLSILGELNLPIILEADIGHKPPQITMMNGAIATVTSSEGRGSIIFERR